MFALSVSPVLFFFYSVLYANRYMSHVFLSFELSSNEKSFYPLNFMTTNFAGKMPKVEK